MRSFHPDIFTLLNNDEVTVFSLIAVKLTNGFHWYHTTLPYNVAIAGLESGNTFISNNGLIGLDTPKLSKVVDRETFKITYSDNERDLISHLSSGVVGSPCAVYYGFFNTTDQVLGGAEPGHPILNLSHTVLAYKGVLDTYGYNIDTETEIKVSLECSSPMAALDLVNVFRTSNDAMVARNPNDTSFSQVHLGSSAVNLVWGKA
jgi:hypothetical protein